MLSIQNYQTSQPKVYFKQNEEQKEQSQNSFSTHAGLKTGIAVAGAGTLYKVTVASSANGIFDKAKGFINELASTIGEDAAEGLKAGLSDAGDLIKSAKKRYYWTIPVTMGTYAGCGALVDKFINDKRANFTKNTQNKDVKDIIANNSDAELSRNGNVYQKSNTGKKYGAALGVVALPVLNAINSVIKGSYKFSLIGTGFSIAIGALGGLTLGAITDHYSNKGAKKFVEKQI